MDMEVLTFRQQGVALLGSVQFASGGPGFVSPSRIPKGWNRVGRRIGPVERAGESPASMPAFQPIGRKVGWLIGYSERLGSFYLEGTLGKGVSPQVVGPETELYGGLGRLGNWYIHVTERAGLE